MDLLAVRRGVGAIAGQVRAQAGELIRPAGRPWRPRHRARPASRGDVEACLMTFGSRGVLDGSCACHRHRHAPMSASGRRRADELEPTCPMIATSGWIHLGVGDRGDELVAPGPEVAGHTPTLPVMGVAGSGVTGTLLVADQHVTGFPASISGRRWVGSAPPRPKTTSAPACSRDSTSACAPVICVRSSELLRRLGRWAVAVNCVLPVPPVAPSRGPGTKKPLRLGLGEGRG